MTDNVVEGRFKQKTEIVFECPFCNEGQTFWLNEDGTITCKACSCRQEVPEGWAERSIERQEEKD